ncbi:protein ANTI-SILENCING 1-like isoform X4 [Miscanthus floridulus]|uniref:protein ANTI-SILENCING 1-like isoform X4 n=1 Tax=Miscanthus floridulus TaxID=154761 RepID=UPI003459ED2F
MSVPPPTSARMDGNSEKIQFSWGKCIAKGVKTGSRYYESFTFDNVKYSLYDCVYLFKHGDPEPYIGKIVKTWEQNQSKKVKILWFFLPEEIQKYLRGPVMEKEIFLASGDGSGLADINPLEAIAGKCTVISKDERNRQPSPREQTMADYIFYRCFDVKNCTLSDELPDKITGLEVNVLLNPKDEQVSSASAANVLLNSNVDEVLAATFTAPCSAAKEDDESPATAVPLSQASVKEVDENPPAAIPLSQSMVKKEDKKSIAAIPLSHSAVKDEKPVVSAPRPQLSVKVNIPKHEESQKAHAGERPPKKLKLSQEATVQDMVPSMTDERPLALPSSQADRSKWFNLPWDDRLQRADKRGTLVYIQNLDIQFGGADLEELVREALQLSCIAKPINHPTCDDPNNGKAYAIFRTKNDADVAISKINSGLVVGGSGVLYALCQLLKSRGRSAAKNYELDQRVF